MYYIRSLGFCVCLILFLGFTGCKQTPKTTRAPAAIQSWGCFGSVFIAENGQLYKTITSSQELIEVQTRPSEGFYPTERIGAFATFSEVIANKDFSLIAAITRRPVSETERQKVYMYDCDLGNWVELFKGQAGEKLSKLRFKPDGQQLAFVGRRSQSLGPLERKITETPHLVTWPSLEHRTLFTLIKIEQRPVRSPKPLKSNRMIVNMLYHPHLDDLIFKLYLPHRYPLTEHRFYILNLAKAKPQFPHDLDYWFSSELKQHTRMAFSNRSALVIHRENGMHRVAQGRYGKRDFNPVKLPSQLQKASAQFIKPIDGHLLWAFRRKPNTDLYLTILTTNNQKLSLNRLYTHKNTQNRGFYFDAFRNRVLYACRDTKGLSYVCLGQVTSSHQRSPLHVSALKDLSLYPILRYWPFEPLK